VVVDPTLTTSRIYMVRLCCKSSISMTDCFCSISISSSTLVQ
jgi:hypothetical protein